MVAATFTPDGIALTTSAYDTYRIGEGADATRQVSILGHRHVVTFWDRYAVVFRQADDCVYRDDAADTLKSVEKRWKEAPRIGDFMPWLKKAIADSGLQIIGAAAGYDMDGSGKPEPYVYEIMGSDIRRINATDRGEIFYNTVFLETGDTVSRLLGEMLVRNGDQLETRPAPRIRCDLFSLRHALQVNRFLVDTAVQFDNINSSVTPESVLDAVTVTPTGLNII